LEVGLEFSGQFPFVALVATEEVEKTDESGAEIHEQFTVESLEVTVLEKRNPKEHRQECLCQTEWNSGEQRLYGLG
jgi:hypothetical protein